MRAPLIAAISLLATLPSSGSAQAPPAAHAAPLRIIVPVAPGGTSDLVARLLADRIAPVLGRSIVVENRPGATGRLAVDALRAAVPGDTLLVAPIAVPVTTPLAYPRLPYGPQDLAPVSQIGSFDYAFAVSAASELRSFGDFVAWARANPSRSNFAGAGAGSIPHFAGLSVAREAGFETSFVAYASIGKLEADLAGGHLASALGATSDFLPLHRAGRIRILATTGRSRASRLPDTPTFRELGYRSLEMTGWTAVFASPRMPPEQMETIARALVDALREPAVRQQLRDAGIEPTGTTPHELAAIITRDIAFWTPVIRASGFVADAP